MVLTRAEATTQGLKKYWDGKPCKNGHDTGRYTSSGVCIGCLNGYRKYTSAADLAAARLARGVVAVRVECHQDDQQAVHDFAAALLTARGVVPTERTANALAALEAPIKAPADVRRFPAPPGCRRDEHGNYVSIESGEIIL